MTRSHSNTSLIVHRSLDREPFSAESLDALACVRLPLRPVPGGFDPLFRMLQLTLTTPALHAQSATVSGQVTDPSSTMVKNVQITLTNDLTNAVLRAKTNEVGIYSLPFVAPGKYTLHAVATGFSPYSQTNITMTTAQNLELDFRIKVGGTEQSVTVDGSRRFDFRR